jgi:hypothetical protein
MLKGFNILILLLILTGCADIIRCNPEVSLGQSSKDPYGEDQGPFKVEFDRLQPGIKCKF